MSKLMEEMRKAGAIIDPNGEDVPHLVLTSGKHSDGYINLREFAGDTRFMHKFAVEMAYQLQCHIDKTPSPKGSGYLLVGPETMGRSLVELVAAQLKSTINYAWCKPSDDKTAMI